MPSLVLDAASPNVVGDCISVLAATHTIGSSLACSQVKPLRVLFGGWERVVFKMKTSVNPDLFFSLLCSWCFQCKVSIRLH